VKFAFANALKRHFEALGHFYSLDLGLESFACRSCIDIARRDLVGRRNEPPDAIVLMSNPGSAQPLGGDYQPRELDAGTLQAEPSAREMVPIRPDGATYQVMRLMGLQRWTRTRILCLSDLRLQDCVDFDDLFHRAALMDATHPHSLFHPGRRSELEAALVTKRGGPVIAAWGTQKPLQAIASVAVETISSRLVGLPHREGEPWFRHASPRHKADKLKWLEDISLQLRRIQLRRRRRRAHRRSEGRVG
jgi:hypothetical protein